MEIADLLSPEHLVVDLVAPDKDRLLRELAERAGMFTGIDKARILSALKSREGLGSTGIGKGIALPHALVAGLSTPFCMFARLARPLDFESIDDIPVDLVFLLLNRIEDASADLSVLSSVVRQLRQQEVLSALRSASNSEDVYAALKKGV